MREFGRTVRGPTVRVAGPRNGPPPSNQRPPARSGARAVAITVAVVVAAGCTPQSPAETPLRTSAPRSTDVETSTIQPAVTTTTALTTTSTELSRRAREVNFRLLAFDRFPFEGVSYDLLTALGSVGCMELDNSVRQEQTAEWLAWQRLIRPTPSEDAQTAKNRAVFDLVSRPDSLCDHHRPYVEEATAIADLHQAGLLNRPTAHHRFLWELNSRWHMLEHLDLVGSMPSDLDDQLAMGLATCELMRSLQGREASPDEWNDEFDDYLASHGIERLPPWFYPAWTEFAESASATGSICPEFEEEASLEAATKAAFARLRG